MSIGEQLISDLESVALFESRYSNLKIVNASATGTRRGVLSLVFKAFDITDGKYVAVKFFDPDRMLDLYRLTAFNREHSILESLIDKKRCLQVKSMLCDYQLSITTMAGYDVKIPIKYFVTEWIEDDIDDYFLAKSSILDAKAKLLIFDQIVLGVKALHRNNVFHRDIKVDNLKSKIDGDQSSVIVIDMGTAALLSSGNLPNSYELPVGAQAYSSPEMFCGFSGDREIAIYTDVYAMGCLLYELFNSDRYIKSFIDSNLHYSSILSVTSIILSGKLTRDEKLFEYHKQLDLYSIGISRVKVDGIGSTIPMGIADLINEALSKMVAFDYRKRDFDFSVVRKLIHSAIKYLENDAAYKRRLEIVKERRLNRIKKAMVRKQRNTACKGVH